MFELHYYGETYTIESPSKSKNFSLKADMLSFVVDLMREIMFPLKPRFMKAKVGVTRHLLTHTIFTRQGIYRFSLKRIL